MDGDFIVDRKMEGMIAAIARERSVVHATFSGGWVQTLKKGDQSAKIIGYKWSINDAASSGIASDKVALYELLAAENIPAIEHQLLRTKADTSVSLHDDVQFPIVLKPLTGTSGHGLIRCESADEIRASIKRMSISGWALSPFVKIDREIRLIVLDSTVVLAYEKTGPTEGNLPLYNLGHGAVPVIIQPNNEQVDVALASMRASGLRLGAVDLVQVVGEWKVLEINDGFMMEHFMRQSDEYYQLTYRLYEKIIDALFW